MKAILIKYLPPTNTHGTRLKLICEGFKPLVVSRKYQLEAREQAREMAIAFIIEAFQGNCKLHGFGMLHNGDYVATIASK